MIIRFIKISANKIFIKALEFFTNWGEILGLKISIDELTFVNGRPRFDRLLRAVQKATD